MAAKQVNTIVIRECSYRESIMKWKKRMDSGLKIAGMMDEALHYSTVIPELSSEPFDKLRTGPVEGSRINTMCQLD